MLPSGSVRRSSLAVRDIDRKSGEPIHNQIYERLRDNIIRGVWKPGDQLPTEPELMGRFQVSRITVRQAFEKLVSQNLVYRQQGRGTFVAHPSIESNTTRIIDFAEDMRQRNLRPSSRVINKQIVPASAITAERLQIQPGDELAFLTRLRLANDEVISLEESFLVHRYCPGILDKYEFAVMSLRRVLDGEPHVCRAGRLVERLLRLARSSAEPTRAGQRGFAGSDPARTRGQSPNLW